MTSPDFESYIVEQISLPFSDTLFIKVSFTDPLLAGFHVIVAKDTTLASCNPGDRITTIIARFARSILAEFNTHRVFGRNSASSRARSVKSVIGEVMKTPYIPVWTINKAGMSGEYASEDVAARSTRVWLSARDKAVSSALQLLIDESIAEGKTDAEVANNYEALLDTYYSEVYNKDGSESTGGLSIHKQDVNRMLEPYLFHEAVVTSTYWENFLELRDHDAAHPAIRALAVLMRVAFDASTPETNWIHAPFIDQTKVPAPGDFEDIRELLLTSASEAAQVSYFDKSNAVKATGSTALGVRLLGMKHLSPFEHQAIAADTFYDVIAPASTEIVTDPARLVSNLSESWIQLRPMLAGITK